LQGSIVGEKYFLVGGQTISERSRAESEIMQGNLLDVIARRIEKNAFFGWWIDDAVDRASDSSNISVRELKNGDKITGTFTVELTDRILLSLGSIDVPKLDYLNSLRTRDGFSDAADLLGVDNAKEATDLLYSPKSSE
jgi:hypothetical protein